MNELEELQPSSLWRHFNNLCAIPRPSGHYQAAAEYVEQFGKQLGFETIKDDTGNVLIRKKASKGKEHHPGVILQAHIDMVPQKNNDTIHDFTRDPIDAFVDGEWVRARGTTLGADNGIGVAAALAVIEDNGISCGPIEALFTIDEETGMTGAMGLPLDLLRGQMLINLDTELEGELFIGCAGGMDVSAILNVPMEKTGSERKGFSLAVKGLKGGHSGIDINLGRGNAIKLMNRLLFSAIESFDIRISEFHGGQVRNAIPREAFATIVVPSAYVDDFIAFVRGFEKTLRAEYTGSDPDLKIIFKEIELPSEVLSGAAQDNVVRSIYACPSGVVRMSDKIHGQVETSGNLSILECKNGLVTVHSLLRSSIESAREDLGNAVLSALSLSGAHVEFSGAYPGWNPDPSSPLLLQMKKIYQSLFGHEPQVKTVHAGLECGIIGAKYPGLDMISCGPTILHPHSPEERAHIGSVERFWMYLRKVLENL